MNNISGLTVDEVLATVYFTQGKLPARWMAIESLQEAKYTSKSDV